MFKTSAVPTVSFKSGEFNNDEFANSVREISPPGGVSISSIINKALSKGTDAAQVIVLLNGQKILVAAHENVKPIGNIAESAGLKTMTIAPVSGQEGRVLAFEQSGAETAGFNADIKATVLELINATRPKYNVASLVQNIAAKIPTLPANTRLAISIDQDNGNVKIQTYSDTQGELNAVSTVEEADSHGAIIALPVTEIVETPTSGDNSLPFEGGAV